MQHRFFLGTTLVAALAFGACGDDDSHDDHPDASATVDGPGTPDAGGGASVTIAFEHLVDGGPVTIGTDTPYTNAAGNAYGVTLVRYFISDVTLTYADASEHAAPGAHYVDHDLAETQAYLLTGVPEGDLAAISFTMGLTPALNVTGAFSDPPESLMEWPQMMGGGYHHMKFEGRYINSASEPFAFKVHSGPLGGTDYSFPVELDATGRAIADGATLTVQMNLEEWFTNPNTWDLNDYFTADHPGIMGDAAAQASLKENGLGVFTLGAP